MATKKSINCHNNLSKKWSNWSIVELFDPLIYSCICIYWYNSFSSFFFYQKIFILIFINFFGSWFIILCNFLFLFSLIFFSFHIHLLINLLCYSCISYNENNLFIWKDGVWVLKLLYLAVQKIRKFVKIYSYWILLLVSTQTSRTTFN